MISKSESFEFKTEQILSLIKQSQTVQFRR